ncbi:MAG: chlorophyll synthesis pathway protein BchC [Rhizobiales bacterium]|nr:chlorophyll synthesis pathway protein BchC [Hyphomicrobiales bacterium]MBO6697243.1 chlorophyll synthesis pathway protein BchC [Hyphomicrobiales bacterium]MBO6736502.1 chlorophyll synthesis pathway protein BchC [Hyphomicrobiales bacterium]MBO6912972.1 chlorophyll synthesis pathway protein BchC [Hyphomicrobiales bacterium]MBO6954140.1 chlorophyll synthesis pathway protein BchC [Hyphomicrobiales bacterium]
MALTLSTKAVVLQAPETLSVRELALSAPGSDDLVVDVDWSGISAGTERLLWSGRMPDFPGMGYPLVPGYESVGRVVDAGSDVADRIGETVFVPGARCFGDVRGLFGGSAARVVVASQRAPAIHEHLGREGVLLALAATAYHALAASDAVLPDLIVGHGVLGRLLARIATSLADEAPTVWETNAKRAEGAQGYAVAHPDKDDRRDFRAIYDVSGDSTLLDSLIGRLSRGGQIVLAGFYDKPLQFAFPPAFMREARLRVAAEWQPGDLEAVLGLIDAGKLSLDGLITHNEPADAADRAYRTAFGDPDCLKMVLDWRNAA